MNNNPLDFHNTPPGTKVKVLLDEHGNVTGSSLEYDKSRVTRYLNKDQVYTVKKLLWWNYFKATLYLEEDESLVGFDAACFTYATPVVKPPSVIYPKQLSLFPNEQTDEP